MAKLHAAARSALPGQDFAGPDRSFPIEDPNHARAALSMAHYASNPAAIREKVHAKFPSIGQKKSANRSAILSQMKGGGC